MKAIILILLSVSFAFAQPNQSKKRQRITVYYFPVLGQSQAGGYNNQPAITTTSNSYAQTLTNGPIDVNTAGNLIASAEGDTFSDTNGPAATANVETIATSMIQQLRTFRNNSPSDIYVSSIHARGGETIQALSKSGSTGRYEEITTSVTRVKAICDSKGWRLIVHPIFFHGGTGDNTGSTYKAKLLTLYNNFETDIKAITGQRQMYLFTHQQRVVGTPDYGIQQHQASMEESGIVVVAPEYPLLLSLGGSVAYQGDAIHITSHGTRYLAMLWARAIYRKIFDTDYRPLELDTENATYNSSTKKLTVPVKNRTGNLSCNTNCGIEVYSNTSAAVVTSTSAIVSNALEITFGDKPPLGLHSLTIRTGVAANGWMKDENTDVPSFNNSASSPYDLDKYMVRSEFPLTYRFPVTMILNFGGVSAAPGLSGIYDIWDSNRSYTDVTYSINGSVDLVCKNTTSAYWGFISTSATKAGEQAVTGTNLYPNGAIGTWWFVESREGTIILRGLDPKKNYKVILAGCRPASGTLRTTIYTINDKRILKQSNRAGTDAMFTTEAECAVFNPIQPNELGQMEISIRDNATTFGYLNVLEIIEL